MTLRYCSCKTFQRSVIIPIVFLIRFTLHTSRELQNELNISQSYISSIGTLRTSLGHNQVDLQREEYYIYVAKLNAFPMFSFCD